MMMEERRITHTERILLLLAETHCLTLSELQQKTQINRKTLLVYLHRMMKRKLISSRWVAVDGKRERLYCLEVKV